MDKTIDNDQDDGASPGTPPQKSPELDESAVARANWDRYVYVSERGHFDYCIRARRLEDIYLGGGRQWRAEDKDLMEQEGRYPIEVNEVLGAVNTALGYQINNRVDISMSPKKQTSEAKATKFSKVLMKVKDDLKYSHYESEMFADGLIQQRGFLDLRVYYDENINGEPGLFLLDPLDVIPDPDAKSYDPDDWADVIVTRWMTGDDIEADYGPEKREQVEKDYGAGIGEEDFGDSLNEESRNRFGDDLEDSAATFDAVDTSTTIPRFRVIDRQYWKMAKAAVAVFPTGDVRNIENANPQAVAVAKSKGAMIIRRPTKRVRWCVTTQNVVLHDDWSPYDHFTVIPFFPTFRRGKTVGMVDNLEGPQELLNSSVTTTNQIVRSTANGGWLVEENSLSNIDTDDLETEGSKNGLILEYRKNSTKPEKIQANTVPSGISDLIGFASNKIKGVSGMTDAARGEGGKNQSGLAAQAQQFAAQLSEAKTLSNLAFTRNLFAQRLTKLLQQTLTEPQVLKITETDAMGQPYTEQLYVNQPDPNEPADAEMFDLTSGEYDYAITDTPGNVTFQNSQYNQALEMRKEGIALPDHVVIKHSNLEDKNKVIKEMAATAGRSNPVDDAKIKLIEAQADFARAQTVAKNIEALFSGARTAGVLATNTALAPAADAVVKSAGFVDKDMAPIYPADVAPVVGEVVPTSTNPLTPDNPEAGMNAGIESGGDAAGAV